MNFIRRWLIKWRLNRYSKSAERAADWLGDCEDPDAVELLLEHASDMNHVPHKSSKINAVKALGRKTDPRTVQFLVELYRADIPPGEKNSGGWESIRKAAEEALLSLGRSAARQHLLLSCADDYQLEWLTGFKVKRGGVLDRIFLSYLFGQDTRAISELESAYLSSNKCPSCHVVVPPAAVICVKCRHDLRSGKKLLAGVEDAVTVVFPFGCPGAKIIYSRYFEVIRQESCFKHGAVKVIGAEYKCSHCDETYKVRKARDGYSWQGNKGTGWCNIRDCPSCGIPLGVYESEFPDGDSGRVEFRCCRPEPRG